MIKDSSVLSNKYMPNGIPKSEENINVLTFINDNLSHSLMIIDKERKMAIIATIGVEYLTGKTNESNGIATNASPNPNMLLTNEEKNKIIKINTKSSIFLIPNY